MIRKLIPLIAVIAGYLALSGASASASVTHVYTGQSFGPGGPGVGAFSNPQAVTVDQSTGDVYVYDDHSESLTTGSGSVYKFEASGEPLKFLAHAAESEDTNVIEGVGFVPALSFFSARQELAFDGSPGHGSGDLYAANDNFPSGGVVEIYDPVTGAKEGELNSEVSTLGLGAPWGSACGVAVDPAGHVYVAMTDGEVNKYTPAVAGGTLVTNSDYTSSLWGVGEGCNLAVDAQENVYIATHPDGPVTKYPASQFETEAQFKAGMEVPAIGSEVDTVGGTLALDPAGDGLFVDEGTQISQFKSAAEGSGLIDAFPTLGGESYGIAVNAHADDTDDGDVYVDDQASGTVDIFGPLVVLPEPVTGSPASSVTGTTATLHGTIDPDETSITSCEFEYRPETEASYGFTVPCASLPGSGNAPVAVSGSVTDLVPGATYHYRLAAGNSGGTADGQDATFTTISMSFAATAPPPVFASARGLPDGRVYELVSPPNKFGNAVAGEGDGPHPFGFAAPDGEAVMYMGDGALASKSASGNLNQLFVSERSSDGWVARAATPKGVSGPPSEPERNNGLFVDELHQFDPSADLSHLAFSTSGAADVGPPDETSTTSSGEANGLYLAGSDPFVEPAWPSRSDVPGAGQVGGVAVGGSPDFSTLYFESSLSLLGPSSSGFYEDRDGVLSDAGALPGGEASASGASPANQVGVGSPAEQSGGNVVSADGSRAFFIRADGAGKTELYAHITAPDGTQSSMLVSPSELAGHAGEPAPDGVVAAASTEWVLPNGTAAEVDAGPPEYVYASADGSHAFFHSTDRLTESAPEGTAAKVYNFDLDTGVLEYLPGVAGSIVTGVTDGSSLIFENTAGASLELERWSAGAGGGSVTPVVQLPAPSDGVCGTLVCIGPAYVSSDGEVVVFSTEAALVGFNDGGSFTNGEAVFPIKQIFRYDASTDELSCVSCPPVGVKPSGDAVMSNADQYLDGLGGGSIGGGQNEVADDRGMSADGSRVFFDTPDPLVAQDTNTRPPTYFNGAFEHENGRDVYEWENGTVFLISSGTSQSNSTLLDSSESGGDVFFTTTDGLVPADTDGSRDVYDARIPRPGDNPPPAAVPCQGEVCQGPPSVPELLGAPASETFSGLGNIAAEPVTSPSPTKTAKKTAKCAKGKKPSKGKCPKVKAKKKGLGKRAGHDGRAKR